MKGNLTCPHKSENDFSKDLTSKIALIENELGELNISSGVRCVHCNKSVGGASNSAHLYGQAVDIEVPNSNYMFKLMKKCMFLGIVRFGFGKTFLHIDINLENPQNVVWNYYK